MLWFYHDNIIHYCCYPRYVTHGTCPYNKSPLLLPTVCHPRYMTHITHDMSSTVYVNMAILHCCYPQHVSTHVTHGIWHTLPTMCHPRYMFTWQFFIVVTHNMSPTWHDPHYPQYVTHGMCPHANSSLLLPTTCHPRGITHGMSPTEHVHDILTLLSPTVCYPRDMLLLTYYYIVTSLIPCSVK